MATHLPSVSKRGKWVAMGGERRHVGDLGKVLMLAAGEVAA